MSSAVWAFFRGRAVRLELDTFPNVLRVPLWDDTPSFALGVKADLEVEVGTCFRMQLARFIPELSGWRMSVFYRDQSVPLPAWFRNATTMVVVHAMRQSELAHKIGPGISDLTRTLINRSWKPDQNGRWRREFLGHTSVAFVLRYVSRDFLACLTPTEVDEHLTRIETEAWAELALAGPVYRLGVPAGGVAL